MSALSEMFARCRAEDRAAFVPFLVAGDPDLDTTGRLLVALERAGADAIEIGVPFSDPIADGPVIQAASERALAGGVTLEQILARVARLRAPLGVPLVLFSYANPILAYGVERFAEQAAASGIDAVLVVDLPPEEAEEELAPRLAAHGVDLVFLLAPTSGRERIDRVARTGSGFVYFVSRAGVTGEQEALATELPRQLAAVRRRVGLPVAVGFGISTPEQVAAVAALADGVVVGSALVRLAHDCRDEPDPVALVEERARQLAAATRRGKPGDSLLGRWRRGRSGSRSG